jgi:hypothetical protein
VYTAATKLWLLLLLLLLLLYAIVVLVCGVELVQQFVYIRKHPDRTAVVHIVS